MDLSSPRRFNDPRKTLAGPTSFISRCSFPLLPLADVPPKCSLSFWRLQRVFAEKVVLQHDMGCAIHPARGWVTGVVIKNGRNANSRADWSKRLITGLSRLLAFFVRTSAVFGSLPDNWVWAEETVDLKKKRKERKIFFRTGQIYDPHCSWWDTVQRDVTVTGLWQKLNTEWR